MFENRRKEIRKVFDAEVQYIHRAWESWWVICQCKRAFCLHMPLDFLRVQVGRDPRIYSQFITNELCWMDPLTFPAYEYVAFHPTISFM
jgi:hypothetical protein